MQSISINDISDPLLIDQFPYQGNNYDLYGLTLYPGGINIAIGVNKELIKTYEGLVELKELFTNLEKFSKITWLPTHNYDYIIVVPADFQTLTPEMVEILIKKILSLLLIKLINNELIKL